MNNKVYKPYYQVSKTIYSQIKSGKNRSGQKSSKFILKKTINYILSMLAYNCPFNSWRIKFHRMRGVKIGNNVMIGFNVILDYSYPEYIASNYFDANNHIFHTLLVNLMSSWFGEENALAIRFPTFVFGIACLWMIYLTALELFHSRKIANTALLIAAVNPVHIHYSQTARGYSLVMFFSIAVIYYSLKLLRSRKEKKKII